MSHPYKAYVDELRHTITVAGLNYEIWWLYNGKDSRPQHIDVIKRYPSSSRRRFTHIFWRCWFSYPANTRHALTRTTFHVLWNCLRPTPHFRPAS
jgi:hypothetical protein